MKSSRLIILAAYSTLINLLIGCSLHHQVPEELKTITGAFGFHFGEKIQSYQIKSEDDEVMVVEPAVIPRPNPLIERYALILDRKNKKILEINGLNHSCIYTDYLKKTIYVGTPCASNNMNYIPNPPTALIQINA